MKRIVKKHHDRREEILRAAEDLFNAHGYEKTSINSIIDHIGIAKGTFYHYFDSKESLLGAIVKDALDGIIAKATVISTDPQLSALKKLETILSPRIDENKKAARVAQSLHNPDNRELHEKLNVEIIIRFSPIIASIVEQGVREKVFHVKNILETVQFVLAGSQFLFDDGLFHWNPKEWKIRRAVMQTVIEKAFGAKKESLHFIKNTSM